MSLQKKIGRWNRFEIAFAEEGSPNASLCREAWTASLGEKRDLRKIEKEVAEATSRSEATTKGMSNVDSATTEERAASDATLGRETASVGCASPSLWAKARQTKGERKRVESTLALERAEKSALEEEKPPLPPRRPRTFRASEPPRRFGDSRDERRERKRRD